MSRKTLLAVLGVILAALTFFKEQFGLSMGVVAAMCGLGTALLYVLFEAKLDLKKIGAQAGRWKDPKFWLAFVAVILAALNKNLGLNLPAETIIPALTAIMAILFGAKFKAVKKSY